MSTDSHKGILGIKYNSLNLPYELLIKNADISGKVYYTYSASGVKLKTRHLKAKNLGYTPVTGTAGDTNLDVAKTTDYVGNKVYEDGTLKRVLVDGGYIEGGVYHYYLTDHLGNNRMIVNQNGVKTQWNHYYPFGTAFADKYDNGTNQPYKYNGKELDQMHGLNLYDYSARYYESAIGRFTTVDPMAEKYYSISPYAYCNNNPLRFIDPTGMWFDEENEKKAREHEEALNKLYTKLYKEAWEVEANGGDASDIYARIGEVSKSIDDVLDMRNSTGTEFRYAKASDKNNPAGKGNPTIDGLGTKVVTMYTEGNVGSKSHEGRHGGDAARGTLTLSNYSISHEVSAYQAQYGATGKINYIQVNELNQKLAYNTGIQPPISQINSMSAITPAFVNSIGTKQTIQLQGKAPVTGLMNLYPPKVWTGTRWYTIPSSQWNK